MLTFLRDMGQALVLQPPRYKAIIEEAYRIGVQSLPILLIISIFVGSTICLQGYNAFAPLGGRRLVGMFVGLAGVRELAPIMVASMVAAKAGTQMASQIAVMRTREQIDALEVMAIHPHAVLVLPRLAGILLVLPALTVICLLAVIISSWAVAVFQLDLNGHAFLELMARTTQMTDVVYCMGKALVFGALICILSCFFGFFAPAGPAGVGKATNRAVVSAAIACAFANYIMSEVLYGS